MELHFNSCVNSGTKDATKPSRASLPRRYTEDIGAPKDFGCERVGRGSERDQPRGVAAGTFNSGWYWDFHLFFLSSQMRGVFQRLCS